MLPFTCSPTSRVLSGTITDITLWKKSTLGWMEIVKIWLKIENGQVVNEITWTNTDVRSRATIVNKKVHPSSQVQYNFLLCAITCMHMMLEVEFLLQYLLTSHAYSFGCTFTIYINIVMIKIFHQYHQNHQPTSNLKQLNTERS
jgi:hypothetical protein